MSKQITLYAAKICPWAHRVELTLKESNLPYKRYEVDLKNKPEWYAPKVNPVGKVPAITYGGPEVPPDEPSPESQKLAESGVLIQFLADLDERLLPKDPVARAKARFFIETATPLISGTFFRSLSRGEDPEAVLEAFDSIQKLLPEEGYAVGEWSIADAAVTPFFARAELAFTNDYGKYEEGKGKAVWEKLQTDEKYARFSKYYRDLKSRPSFNETFYSDVVSNVMTTLYQRQPTVSAH